jgi:uncharacterized protein
VKLAWLHSRGAWLVVSAAIVIALGVGGVLAETLHPHPHQVVFQINTDDIVSMKHAVSNSTNLVRYFRDRRQPVQIEIVAYDAGIAMLRDDQSPVRDVLGYIHTKFPEIAFTVCGSSKAIIEQREGHPVPLIEGTRVVPFGIVRIVGLQEAGWSYIRP